MGLGVGRSETKAFSLIALALCGCPSVVAELPPDGGGGGGLDPGTGGGATGGEGQGGQSDTRTIVIGREVEGDKNPDSAVFLSTPDGTVYGTWRLDELPVEVAVSDGDLVSVAYAFGEGSSHADTFRITPEVKEVSRFVGKAQPPYMPCERTEGMTLTFDIPHLDDIGRYRLWLDDAMIFSSSTLSPGPNEIYIEACAGATSFDFVMVFEELGSDDPIAFARIADVAYVPGGAASLPIEPVTERDLIDFTVEAKPGTEFGVTAMWQSDEFHLRNYFGIETSMVGTVGTTGSANVAYGPFALGDGYETVSVSSPPEYLCELDSTWRSAPVGPVHARIGALANFALLEDGNVALASEGEFGDVMLRSEFDYLADGSTFYWVLHEDPNHPYPMPARPDIPLDVLPDFQWPGPGAYREYAHEDLDVVDGYASYTQNSLSVRGGRSRRWSASWCGQVP